MSEPVLEKILGDIPLSHAQRFDPVRFAYIRSLANRLEQPMFANNVALAAKLQTNVDLFLAEFISSRKRADGIVDEICLNFVEHKDRAVNYSDQGDFKQLDKLNVELQNKSSNLPNTSLLSQLNSVMSKQLDDIKREDKPLSFDDILQQQEQALTLDQESITEQSSQNTGESLELQSMAVFRESMKYFNIDKIIDRAINDCPANPGPHNPHMLAIKSLTHMRELSPQYLRRFASYIETLLWLEKNSTKLGDIKK